MATSTGHLVIIGGVETKPPARDVLIQVAMLAGGVKARIVILDVASKLTPLQLAATEAAVRGLGVAEVDTCRLERREDADGDVCGKRIEKATGLILIGSDPQRLVNVLSGTRAERLCRDALERRGACLAVTGGAASAVSRHMVKESKSDIHPREGLIQLAPGLGLLDRIVIDHHFSDRQRMGRLLAIISQASDLLGVGIDDKTALVVAPGRSLSVVGSATVTILDGRAMSYSTVHEVPPGAILAMGNVQLHLLPPGFAFDLERGLADIGRGGESQRVPAALREMVALVVSAQASPTASEWTEPERSDRNDRNKRGA